MIINIRGTNGSGKTTTVRQVMEQMGGFLPVHLAGTNNKVVGYYNYERAIKVLGSYETPTGGCDTIKTQEEVRSAVLENALKGRHVIFEGVVISTIHGPYADLATTLRGHGVDMYFCYMDTPLERCFANLKARQTAAGKPDKVIKEQLVLDKFRSIESTRQKFIVAGYDVRTLNFGQSADQVINMLSR